MAPAPEPKPVAPQPGLPKTIGALNVVFGCTLFLCGLNSLNQVGPSMAQNRPTQFEPDEAQAFSDELRRSILSEIQAHEQASEDEAEKARLKKERLALEAKHPTVAAEIDLKQVNRDLLWVSWYLWADVATGPVLNLLMLASGIGLMQLRGWARSMAVWVAALKLVRLVVLSILLIAVVIPRASRVTGAFLATETGKAALVHAMAQQNAGTGAPPTAQLSPEDFLQVVRALCNISSVLFLVFGAIIPVLTLVVLTRPAARAACTAAEAEDDA